MQSRGLTTSPMDSPELGVHAPFLVHPVAALCSRSWSQAVTFGGGHIYRGSAGGS